MASIKHREGKLYVQIRKKNIDLYATFSNENDAILWARYKEEMIDLISNFDPPLKEMISLNDAIDLKIESIQNIDKKTLNDYSNLKAFFEIFINKKLNQIAYSDLMNHFENMIKVPVTRGGSNKKNGNIKTFFPSPVTIFRKFAYLSTVYQNMIEKGVEIDNIAIKICQYMRPKLKNHKDDSLEVA